MKTLRARIAAILLVAAMGITLSACSKDDADDTLKRPSADNSNAEVSDNGDKNEENSSAENNVPAETNVPVEDNTDFMKQEITFGLDPYGQSDNVQDPTEAPSQQATAAPQTKIVTKKVVVTEAGGAAVTDAEGEKVTEVQTEVQTEAAPYVPAPVSEPIYWLNMTKGSDGNYDKVFNGEMFVFEFKIKEGTPDGNYPIILSAPDFVNWDEEQLDVKTVSGYVTVGDVAPTQPSQVQPGQFTISASGVQGKVGDTIKVVLNISDNPGLVAMLFRVEFDQNALEYVTSYAGSAMAGL